MSIPSKYKIKSGHLNFVSNYMEESVPFNKVICVQVHGKTCSLYIKDMDPFITYIPFRQLVKQLPESMFVQVNRSTVVSIKEMENITGNVLYLSNNLKLIISEKYQSNVLKAYNNKAIEPKCILQIEKDMDISVLYVNEEFLKQKDKAYIIASRLESFINKIMT